MGNYKGMEIRNWFIRGGGEIVRRVGWEGWIPGISKIVSKSVYELILFKKLSHLILSEFLT